MRVARQSGRSLDQLATAEIAAGAAIRARIPASSALALADFRTAPLDFLEPGLPRLSGSSTNPGRRLIASRRALAKTLQNLAESGAPLAAIRANFGRTRLVLEFGHTRPELARSGPKRSMWGILDRSWPPRLTEVGMGSTEFGPILASLAFSLVGSFAGCGFSVCLFVLVWLVGRLVG